MFIIDNKATVDAFSKDLTLDNMEPCQKINLSVSNAAVKVSEKHAMPNSAKASGQDWEQEYTVMPSERSLIRTRLIGIRFRSAATGKPAQVTCVAFAPHES